ncbi:MAG: diacylglycerol kinase family protein [Usitatibacter sp.]
MLHVIINSNAGPGHPPGIVQELEQLIAQSGVTAQVHCASGGEQFEALLRKAVAQFPPVVIVGGGDGTVSSAARITLGTPTALGILPMGTLNHFARDLLLPTVLSEAVRVAISGRATRVDTGEVNGVAFLNNSSIGLYPDVVRDRQRQQRRLGRSKRAAMLWAVLAVLRRTPLLRMRLELDGKAQEFRGPFVFVGNNNYLMEGFRIGSRERLDQGRLSVYTTRRSSAGALLGLAMRALFHRLHQAHDFAATFAQQLTVELKHRRVLVAVDGEVRSMETPLVFRINPRSLVVLTPLEVSAT